MRQAFSSRRTRVLVAALATTMGLGGLTSTAQAFTINTGDLTLAVYANGTEYYRNLGQSSLYLTPGLSTTIDLGLSSLNPMSAVSGVNPVQWTLVRNTFAPPAVTAATNFINVTDQQTAQQLIDSQSQFSVPQAGGAIRSWESAILATSAPLGNELLLNASDPASFTTTMGINGDLNGSFFQAGGGLGTALTMLLGKTQGNVITDVGRAILLANGQLTICGGADCSLSAVPLPAAAVLFGSGLVGLVGIARRRLSGRVIAG